eukprot:13588310-Alexandrium_andersonii.AAC.1
MGSGAETLARRIEHIRARGEKSWIRSLRQHYPPFAVRGCGHIVKDHQRGGSMAPPTHRAGRRPGGGEG